VEPNAQVGQFEGQVLTLAFTTSGLAGAFGRADHADNLRQAIHKTIGIDCQIQAIAAGSNSSASSEPNPKAPASPDVPATSADAAWGLVPDTRQAAPEPAPSAEPSPATSAGGSTAPVESRPVAPSPGAPKALPVVAAESPVALPSPAQRPDAAADAALQASRKTVATPAPEAEPESLATADPSGSYDYPDDDWGPPRDEDAPPLDEEPPMDWDPSASSASPAVPSAVSSAPSPARRNAAPANARNAAPAASVDNTPTPGGGDDPWARAVEQSPGVWTVGAESNVGGNAPPAEVVTPQPAHEPEPETPRYAPAAAQIPEHAAAVSAAAFAVPDSAVTGSAVPDIAADDWGLPQLVPVGAAPADRASLAAADIAPMTAPSTPMASPTAPVADPALPAAQDTAGRQSLYQRLSNSPEAEAGRAKAPARAAAATTYVQDVPSADDETIEESGVFGRAAVERILGGKLVEERSLDGSPLAPRI
jgi:DNA polymerase-3 subunit gamma/tau